jgi:hypothetical protein
MTIYLIRGYEFYSLESAGEYFALKEKEGESNEAV